MTHDSRALWDLVDEWNGRVSPSSALYGDGYSDAMRKCRDQLKAILERPVVVTGEELERACKAYSAAYTTPTEWKKAMRAALESMVRWKS